MLYHSLVTATSRRHNQRRDPIFKIQKVRKMCCVRDARNTRINVINPTVLTEAWDVYGEMMQGFEPVPGKLVGKAFERSVDEFITGEVVYVDI